MATTSKQPLAPLRPKPNLNTQKPLLKLVMSEIVAANFLVPPDILKKYVPKGVELDFFGDETYVSLVCMVVSKPGLLGISFPPKSPHLSLRFYVRRSNDPLHRRGTCSIRNYVSSPTMAWMLGSKLEGDYQKMRMKKQSSGFDSKSAIPEAVYEWKVGDHWNKLRIRGRNRIKNAGPETKIGFILSHPNVYRKVKGKTSEFQVQRPAWKAWDVGQANFSCDVEKLFGKAFVKPLARRPASVFVSSGSEASFLKRELF